MTEINTDQITVEKLREAAKDPILLRFVKAYLVALTAKTLREEERDAWYADILANKFELHISKEWEEKYNDRARLRGGTRILDERHMYLADFFDPVYLAIRDEAEAHWRELGYLKGHEGDVRQLHSERPYESD